MLSACVSDTVSKRLSQYMLHDIVTSIVFDGFLVFVLTIYKTIHSQLNTQPSTRLKKIFIALAISVHVAFTAAATVSFVHGVGIAQACKALWFSFACLFLAAVNAFYYRALRSTILDFVRRQRMVKAQTTDSGSPPRSPAFVPAARVGFTASGQKTSANEERIASLMQSERKLSKLNIVMDLVVLVIVVLTTSNSAAVLMSHEASYSPIAENDPNNYSIESMLIVWAQWVSCYVMIWYSWSPLHLLRDTPNLCHAIIYGPGDKTFTFSGSRIIEPASVKLSANKSKESAGATTKPSTAPKKLANALSSRPASMFASPRSHSQRSLVSPQSRGTRVTVPGLDLGQFSSSGFVPWKAAAGQSAHDTTSAADKQSDKQSQPGSTDASLRLVAAASGPDSSADTAQLPGMLAETVTASV